jgi:phenylalanyl-tRNA synthetase beta chain
MKLPLDWMREFVDVPDRPAEVAAKLGACGFEVAAIEGDVIDFEITANRPDCLSVYGLAREAATAFDLPLAEPPSGATRPGSAGIPVSVGDPGCGRYAAALADVTIGPSPAWLADRLTAAGVRPINNIVDVTNYVMLEIGHPLHAFDAAKLAGPEIRVRRARKDETLTTLDGESRTLDETMLVIADRERAVAVAGVMGGAPTEVSAGTTRVVLESAWFQPVSVRTTARKLGLKTEASSRFERGADATAPVRALKRALSLIEQIGAGRSSGGISDVCPRPHEPRRIAFSRAHLVRLLGEQVPDADVQRILSRLGFTPTPAPDGWTVDVPPFRVDVSREADLIEEVGRHWGFDRIRPTFPPLRTPPRPIAPAVARDRRLRRLLCAAGLQETCTFTFIEREAAAPFALSDAGIVAIANPLSEKFAVLRPSLLPGLLDALIYSRRRETDDVALFEIGAAFLPGGEISRAAWLLSGERLTHWSGQSGMVDMFDAIGVAELLGEGLGATLTAVATDARPWFVRGRAADLRIDTAGGPRVVGSVGELRADLVAGRGLAHGAGVVGGELDLSAFAADAVPPIRPIDPLPRYPSIVRDLSILVDERLPAADVRGTIRSTAPDTLVDVREFDRYAGKGVPEGMVSLSIRLTFRDPARTLTDSDVQRAVDAIIAALAAAHGAVLRGK